MQILKQHQITWRAHPFLFQFLLQFASIANHTIGFLLILRQTQPHLIQLPVQVPQIDVGTLLGGHLLLLFDENLVTTMVLRAQLILRVHLLGGDRAGPHDRHPLLQLLTAEFIRASVALSSPYLRSLLFAYRCPLFLNKGDHLRKAPIWIQLHQLRFTSLGVEDKGAHFLRLTVLLVTGTCILHLVAAVLCSVIS